ncbi:hypothetical protein FGIG_03483 [Fasciola gigantica]|uniref:CortBP2/NAV1-like AAA+ ATPase lid domain-containing protein n=1 Tax=Fasciola gigantica TaxID=46835 RepID=A0A504YG75_FASGI|nr:hypothetical protein FGIG_03483 [Fasciola gigantica]
MGLANHPNGGRNSEPRSLPQHSQMTNFQSTGNQSHTQVVPPYQVCSRPSGQPVKSYPKNLTAPTTGYNVNMTRNTTGRFGADLNGRETACTHTQSFSPIPTSEPETSGSLYVSNSHMSSRPNEAVPSTQQSHSHAGGAYQQATVDARLISSPTVGSILRLPGKQTSMDEICGIPHTITPHIASPSGSTATQTNRRSSATNKSRTGSIPSSNSAASSLSAGDEKIFCDSGISSSSYSKDSACTSPSDQPIVKLTKLSEEESAIYIHNSDVRQDSLSEPRLEQKAVRKTNDSEPRSATSVFPSTYSAVPQLGIMRARSTEPQSSQMTENYPVSGNGTPSKLQRPTTIVNSVNHSSCNATNAECSIKMTQRQKARELYSLVRNREEKLAHIDLIRRPVNSFDENRESPNRTEANLPASLTISSKCQSQGNVYPGQYGLPNGNEWHVSPETIESHRRKRLAGSQVSKASTKQSMPFHHDPNFKAGTFMSHSQYSGSEIAQNRRLLSSKSHDAGQTDEGVSERDKIRSTASPMDTQHPRNEHLPPEGKAHPATRTGRHLKLTQSLDQFHKQGDQKCVSKSTLDLSSCQPISDSLVESVKESEPSSVTMTTDLADPEQLLSSLSKLNLDPSQGNGLWDDSYFSDVESEYAALELLLPFSQSTFKAGDSTRDQGEPFCENSKLREAGYFSDTETIFTSKSAGRPSAMLPAQVEHKSNWQQTPVYGPSHGQTKPTPVASVAPIMASSSSSLLSSLMKPHGSHMSLNLPKTNTDLSPKDPCAALAAFEAELAMGADGLFDLDYVKWPRLRSAQSISHSISNDKSVGVHGAGEANLPQQNSLLDHIKLPYSNPLQCNMMGNAVTAVAPVGAVSSMVAMGGKTTATPAAASGTTRGAIPMSALGLASVGQLLRDSSSNYAINQKTASSPTTSLPDHPLRAGPSLFHLDALGVCDPKIKMPIVGKASNAVSHSQRWLREQSDPPGSAVSTNKEGSTHTFAKLMNAVGSTEIERSGREQSGMLHNGGKHQPNMLIIPRSVPLYPTVAEDAVNNEPIVIDSNKASRLTCQPLRQISFRQDKYSSTVSSSASVVERDPVRPRAQVRPQGKLDGSSKEEPLLETGGGNGKLVKADSLKSTGGENSKRFGIKWEKQLRKNSSGKCVRSPSPCVTIKLSNSKNELNKDIGCRSKHAMLELCTVKPKTMNRLIETERTVREELASRKTRGISPISPSVLEGIHPKQVVRGYSAAPNSAPHTSPCSDQLIQDEHTNDTVHLPASCVFAQPTQRGDNHTCMVRGMAGNTINVTTDGVVSETTTTIATCPPCAIVHPIKASTADIGLQEASCCYRSPSETPMTESSSSDFVNTKPCPILTVSLCEMPMDYNGPEDSKIRELKSTVNQLRTDITKIQSNHLTTAGMYPRPPRSTSCRAIPDNLRQHESHETVSLSSLTSGASSGTPELNCDRMPSPAPDLLTRHSPSPVSDGERTPGKRNRWVGSNEQSAQNLLLRMRWELNCLEADNKRLRRLILNIPALTDPPDAVKALSHNVVTLTEMEPTICSYTLQCNRASTNDNSKVIRYRPNVDVDEPMDFAPNMQTHPDCPPAAWIVRSSQNGPVENKLTWFSVVHLDGSVSSSVPEIGNTNSNHCQMPSEQTQLNLLSFETLIPVDLLRGYLREMREHRLVVLCGPPGTRKTRILHKVAELLVQDSKQPNSIRSFYVKPNGSTMIKELQCFIAQHLATFNRHGIPQVMILENLHHIQGSLVEMLDTLTKNHPTSWPVILATSDLLNDQLKVLETRFAVHFIEHLTDFDSTASYLSSYLRRKLAQARLFLPKPCSEQSTSGSSLDNSDDDTTLTQLVTWIPKVWKHLNRLSSAQFQHACPAIFGLRIFLACPIDVAASKHWFTDLWNNLFIPFLFKTRSTDEIVHASDTHGIRLSDSFDWIMATWPWPREKSDTMSSSVGRGVTEMSKTEESFWTLPPASPTPSAQKHSTAVSNRIALAQNRTSQDSGIISDGYLNMYGTNLDKQLSKESGGVDRFSGEPSESCSTPCAVLPPTLLHSLPQNSRGCKTPDPNQTQSPCLGKRNQRPEFIGNTSSNA